MNKTAHRWLLFSEQQWDKKVRWELPKPEERSEDPDDVKVCRQAHTGRELGNWNSSGLFSDYILLLNGISE